MPTGPRARVPHFPGDFHNTFGRTRNHRTLLTIPPFLFDRTLLFRYERVFNIFTRRGILANHPSALKRARQNEKRRIRNASTRTRIRNLMKKVRVSLQNNSLNDAETALREAIPRIQKAASSGVIHRNTSRRYISRLSSQVAALAKKSA